MYHRSAVHSDYFHSSHFSSLIMYSWPVHHYHVSNYRHHRLVHVLERALLFLIELFACACDQHHWHDIPRRHLHHHFHPRVASSHFSYPQELDLVVFSLLWVRQRSSLLASALSSHVISSECRLAFVLSVERQCQCSRYQISLWGGCVSPRCVYVVKKVSWFLQWCLP